jgi:hypothetical protein
MEAGAGAETGRLALRLAMAASLGEAAVNCLQSAKNN